MRLLQLITLTSCFFLFNCNSKKQPNIILIVVDDLGWTDLTCYGSDLYQTPNVDKLASQGISFTNAYAACTVCSPTRAAIMTGKYPATLHCTDFISGHRKPFAKMAVPDWTMYLDPKETTLPEALKTVGYNTIHIGKWHLGDDEKYWPEYQGFDENIGGWSRGAPQKNKPGNGYFSPYGNPRLSDGPKGEYLTERLSEEAINYIENHKNDDSPFFMNLWFYNVHMPPQAKQDKIDKYKQLVSPESHHKNPVYAAMVEHMDDAVGKLLDKLEATGLDKNTIILFTSDNGGLMSSRKITSNYPLRDGKGSIYEGGVRVPFIAKWPDKIPQGKKSNTPIISNDIFPTLLGLIKKSERIDTSIQGADLSKLLLEDGYNIERQSLFWHYPHYHGQGAKPYSSIRKGDWKLIEVFEHEELELYNLKDDISESNNLVSKHPKKVKELLNDLKVWRREVNAQIPKLNPMYSKEHSNVSTPKAWEKYPDSIFIKHFKSEN